MAPSIHFHDVFSSFFSKQAKFSVFLDVHADQFDFPAKLQGRDYSTSLYSVKLQSPLAKDTDEGKDFIKSFVIFFRSF